MGERRGMKALELWCRRVTQGYPGVKIENMTTSWRDGLAFCAIIHHFRPDLIDFSRLDKSDIYGNNELAFRIAERHLGIPSLLDAEDMLEYPVPDRLSILTYLSLFYQAFASNSSSPVKRAPETPDGSLMLVSPSVPTTPTKGSVGRGREPCAVCGLPVFIAQRLRVSGKLYHRTCFRCARCETQLNIADCYETQTGEFCCETCPDEMKEEEDPKREEEQPTGSEPLLPVAPEPPPPTSIKPSLVGLRRMMFESYGKEGFNDNPLIVDSSALTEDTPSVNSRLDSSAKDLPVVSRDNRYELEEDVVSDLVAPQENTSAGKIVESIKEALKEKEIIVETVNQVVVKPENDIVDSVAEAVNLEAPLYDSDSEVKDKNSLIETQNKNLSTAFQIEEMAYEEHKIEKANFEGSSSGDHLDSNIPSVEVILTEKPPEEVSIENLEETPKNVEMPKSNQIDALDRHVDEDNFVKERVEEVVETLDETMSEIPEKSLEVDAPFSIDKEIADIAKSLEEAISKIPQENIPLKIDDEDNSAKERSVGILTEEAGVQLEVSNEDSLYPEDLNPFAEDEASTNPFGSDFEDDVEETPKKEKHVPKQPVAAESSNPFWSGEEEEEEEEQKKKPIPLPRKILTPEPSPMPRTKLRSSGRSIGSVSSLARRKKPAPPPPPSPAPSFASYASTTRSRKNRRAPLPPGQTGPTSQFSSSLQSLPLAPEAKLELFVPKDEQSKEEKPIGIEGKKLVLVPISITDSNDENEKTEAPAAPLKEESNLETIDRCDSVGSSVSQRRRIIPLVTHNSNEDLSGKLSSPRPASRKSFSSTSSMSLPDDISYQDDLYSPPSVKKHKDQANLEKQTIEGGSYSRNKSTYGQWKRKKGPAPSIPFPERRPLKPMPMLKLKQELEDIEVKQQGLERQGVTLEKRIREQFTADTSITPYVEEMVLQLFELVNEKNDLFRRQAELMYLRRQFHLEEEHAELEYQIRCLMARPEANKTDSDKELEELLIQRLVEVVERRDAIVQCLERDRLREAEEDESVNAQLNKFSAAMGGETTILKSGKLKQKKTKKDKEKLSSAKTVDLDKDLDESEKEHKKKKKWFTLNQIKSKH